MATVILGDAMQKYSYLYSNIDACILKTAVQNTNIVVHFSMHYFNPI